MLRHTTFHEDGGLSNPVPMLSGLVDHPNPVAAMRSLSPLPKNANELLDNEILRVGRQGLVIARAMIDAGMVKPLPGWLGVPVLTSNKINEVGRAQRTTAPVARGERQVADITQYSVPVYTTWDDWEFDARTLATARRNDYAIDTNQAEQATRNVNESIEDTVINGFVDEDNTPINAYGIRTYGLLNAPNANTVAYSGGLAWDNAAKTGSQIITDVRAMIAAAKAALYNGPYRLFIPTLYGLALSADYTANYPKTILSRVLEIPGLQAIEVADFLPANRTVLMQMTKNVADLVVGQTPAQYNWATTPGHPFTGVSGMVLACVIPRMKSDYNNKSGIVLGDLT